MKKTISTLLILCLLEALLPAFAAVESEFGQVTKVADMLFEVTFDEYSTEIPPASAYEQMSGDMGCSSVRNGGFVGRNFDYLMNQCPTFVIRTTAKEGRYATIGVGRLAKIDSETVEAGLPQEKLDLLPWFLLDGMNEKGLAVNSNVLYKADWGEVPHTGTNPDAPEMNVIFITRALLDYCATVDEAVAYLQNFNITPMNSETMDLHYMISDPDKTCVVEFINNEIVVKEQYIMTNYFINMDEIPEHPDGLERMQILRDNYEEGNTMEGMYRLMQRVRYTNLYDASNGWYSELGLTYEQLQNVSEEAEAALQMMQTEYEDELEYIKENGFRETTEWWDTTHNAIYDINNGKLWVTVHERYEEAPHEFVLQSASPARVETETRNPAVKCYNGTFVGSEKNGVLSYKGIPFAKAPVGELRWKAPQSVEASDGVFDATGYGKAALQPYASSEPVSWNPENMSEDCLTLNIWTTGNTEKKKPVMFWMHGGAYSYGSAIDTLYSGQYMVEEHPDIVVVNANYRLGPLGFIDFTGIEGGEKFPTSGYNGLLDQIEALKWIQQNIEGFGGDPDNVTIFGESAGAGSVCALLVAEGTEGLFQHAIAQSGGLNFTYTHEDCARIGAANLLLKKANAACMDDLMKLSEEEFFEIYTDESDGESLSYFSYVPLRGENSIIPEDPYQAILDGAGKDVDLMIGTTADEYNYFIFDMLDPSPEEEGHVLSEETKNAFSSVMLDSSVDCLIGKCTDEEKENIKEFMELYPDQDEFWQKLALMTETSFRSPAIKFAENHIKAGGTGKTYMYYFAKRNTYFDWIGASHACELPYVFHNFEKEQEMFSGSVIHELADQVCGAWASFAQFADPSYNGVEWPEYSLENRETMMFNDDGTTSIENDPLSDQRELMAPLMYHYNVL